MPERIYNFSAGPATLPYSVLEEAAQDIVNFKDKGIGLIEMSHRSKEFMRLPMKLKPWFVNCSQCRKIIRYFSSRAEPLHSSS
ncbi:phosphoserine aminotransferase apoenzyme [Candidatus Electrothrix aarhusensis]|uniref:Phosphoserine aminotransferase apoenzyme n=1 Tax=Candidatus Electrothrix aarhusensis TaxID=1859131 RepID=A0A3S3QH67_9BACT|nr:phosphoserine aminotransferase apoenzyme [Candidatus Electrothrix aarhusensis]